MKDSGRGLVVLLAIAAGCSWLLNADLPPVVASHFSASGAADGHMTRDLYRVLMLLLGVGVPAIVAFAGGNAMSRPGARLNLPNRDYWLAPSRREQTVAFLRNHMAWFAAALAVFLLYVQWLVVDANRHTPPTLALSRLLAGLGIFLLVLAIWIGKLMARFSARRMRAA
jgi:hypothetical protein